MILLYDSWAKHQGPLGPVVMGACRGLNLLLGIAAAPAVLAGSWPLTLIPFTYIAAVTVVSRGEVHGGKRGPAALALVSLGGVVAALGTIAAAAGAGRRAAAGAVAVLLAFRVIPPFWRVYRDPAPAGIRQAVRTGVLSLVLVDATLGGCVCRTVFWRSRARHRRGCRRPGAVICGYLRWTRSSRRYTSPFSTRCTSPRVSFRPGTRCCVISPGVRAPRGGGACSWCSTAASSGPTRILAGAVHRYFTAHQSALELAGPVVVVPGGEQAKNDPAQVERLLQAIHDAALCRHSYVVAVGGGAVLDAAGFAAATAHRGVRLIRVPDDRARAGRLGGGVKNGVNAFGKKNYLGTFAPPFAVINDFAFLSTLSDRDWRGGMTEAVKAALIRDAAFFDFLEEHAAALVAAIWRRWSR